MSLSWLKQPWRLGTTFESGISLGMNAPAYFVAYQLAIIVWANRVAWFAVSYLLYFVLVGVLWYAVAVEASGTSGSTIMSFIRRKVLRRISDALLIAFGLFLALLGFMNLVFAHGGETSPELIPMKVGYLLWGFAIAGFYARDFWITSCAQPRQQVVRE